MTGTPRVVAKLNGFLTGPSDASPKAIALGYLRGHATAFGLDAGDISSLRLTRQYTDVRGTTHFVWAQVFDGVQALDNGVYANVSRDGRLVNVMGSPVPDLGVRTTQPEVSARGALTSALGNAGVPSRKVPAKRGTAGADSLTRFAGGTDDARLVLFTESPGVTKLAWRVTANASSTELYDYVIDASTGKVLSRTNTVDFATGSVWEYAPNLNSACPGCGAAAGAQTNHTFPAAWGTAANSLNGDFAHVYTDIDDNDQPDAASGNCPNCGQIPTNGGGNWTYSFAPNPGNGTGESGSDCFSIFPQAPGTSTTRASRAGVRTSARTRPRSTGTSTTTTTGSRTRSSGSPRHPETSRERTPSRRQTFDGAASDTSVGAIPGTPDDNHVNNANMLTQADGIAPQDADVSLLRARARRTCRRNGGDDDERHLPRVHARALQPAGDGSGRHPRPALLPGQSDGRGLERLVCARLPRGPEPRRGQHRHGRADEHGRLHDRARTSTASELRDSTARFPPTRRPTAPAATRRTPAATRWATWAASSIGRSSTRTARSGRRRSGTYGTTGSFERPLRRRLREPDPVDHHGRHAALASRPELPRHAQRDPSGGQRPTSRRTRPSTDFVWQTFAHRGMGYFASDQGSADTSPTPSTALPPSCGPCGT